MLAIFLDQETTGLDAHVHRTIEIAFQIYDVAAETTIARYSAVVKESEEVWQARDLNSLKINGFTWEEISQGKDVATVSSEIVTLLNQNGIERGKAVFVCQNPSFDRGFFNHLVPVAAQEKMHWPYHWLDLASMYWAARLFQSKREGIIFPREFSLSKDEIAKFYGLPPEQKPHRAMNGVAHLMLCYQELFNQ